MSASSDEERWRETDNAPHGNVALATGIQMIAVVVALVTEVVAIVRPRRSPSPRA